MFVCRFPQYLVVMNYSSLHMLQVEESTSVIPKRYRLEQLQAHFSKKIMWKVLFCAFTFKQYLWLEPNIMPMNNLNLSILTLSSH